MNAEDNINVTLPGDVINKKSPCCPSVVAACYRPENKNPFELTTGSVFVFIYLHYRKLAISYLALYILLLGSKKVKSHQITTARLFQ